MNKQYDNAIYQLSCIHLNQTRQIVYYKEYTFK